MKNIKILAVFEGFEQDHVKTDRMRLQQVVHSLLSNALKFTDCDGQIIISIKHQNKKYLLLDRNYLLISVVDNGRGIKKKIQGKIFKEVSCTDENQKFNFEGFGHGLAISKMIVKKFGG
jgi:signal transduction histidine kinase